MKVFRCLLSKSVSKVARVCALALLCAALVSPASAYAWGGGGNNCNPGGGNNCNPGGGGNNCHPGGGGGGAPEIDPNSLAGALTILSGGVVLLTDRFRRK
jgi:hypothetical protein